MNRKDRIARNKIKELEIYRFRSAKPIRDYVYKNVLDNLQRSKVDFLLECYSNDNTQQSYYSLYNNNIKPMEELYNKDLMYFNAEECNDIISGKFYLSEGMKTTIKIFITKYKEWGVSKGLITVNQALFMDDEIVKDKKVLVEKKLMDMESFEEFMLEIQLKSNSFRNCVPYILARYGIMGNKLEFMQNLEYADIDYENKKVYVNDKYGNRLGYYIVDDYFIGFLDKMKPYKDYSGIVVIKNNKNFKKGELETYNSLSNKTFIVSRALGIKRIPYSKIVLNRKLELLLKIRTHKRLTREDFVNVLSYIDKRKYATYNTPITTLVNFYETLTKDEIISLSSNELLVDEDSISIVNKICKNINFNIDLDNIPYLYDYSDYNNF